jgi:hypothetical protein
MNSSCDATTKEYVHQLRQQGLPVPRQSGFDRLCVLSVHFFSENDKV